MGAPRPARARSDRLPDWDGFPHPLGGETLLLVLEVYGWLNWANSGYMRNRPFDAVLLPREGGNREVPPGGWVAREEQERVLTDVILAGWPDREPGWPVSLEGQTLLRVTDAEANVWLPRALRAALIHWRYCPGNPSPHTSGGAGNGRTHK